MNMRHMRPLIMLLGAVLVSWLAASSPVRAQYAQFQTGRFTTTPITFDLGGGVIGTVTFTGATAGSSGLQTPTASGSNLVSNFILIQPGTTAFFSFNYPLSHLDLNWGPGNTVTRTDNFIFNTAQTSNIPLPLTSNLANRSGAFSGAGLDIVSFSLSSTSASPIKLGVLTSTAPVVAPMSPVGATLVGNIVAIGMIALYRRRRNRQGGERTTKAPMLALA